MEKALIIASIFFASTSVFGMNIQHDRRLHSFEKRFLHAVKKHDSSVLAKKSSRLLEILNERNLRLSMQNNLLKQENFVLKKDMAVDQLMPSDIEKLEQKITILSDRVQDEKHLKISSQKQVEDLKSELENAKLDLDVTKLNLDEKQLELAQVKQERDAVKRELAETKRKLDEAISRLEGTAFSQNNTSTSKTFNIFF